MRFSTTLLLTVMLVPILRLQQNENRKKAACDQAMTFCWYDEEVIAQGNRWVNQDPKRNIQVGITIRCVKSLNVCIRARSYKNALDKNLIVTGIELMPITHWDDQQVTANAENYQWEPCDRDSYVINRPDRSVLMISSPGPKADTPACTNILGKPRTVTYKLSQ